MNERELKDLEVVVKRCQRNALVKAFDRLMERVNLIDKVLYSDEGQRIRYDTHGEKFLNMSEKWRQLLTIERTLCSAAHEIVKITKEYSE